MALVPKHILNLSPYVAGKRISEIRDKLAHNEVIKLSSNENPLGPSGLVLGSIKKNLNDLHRYPDSSGIELRSKLAEIYNLKVSNVILGSGSEGIMSTIMRTFLRSDDEIIAAKNSFIGFKVLANASGKNVVWVSMKDYKYDLKSMSDRINDYTKIIYLANPDNPTGTYFNKKEFDGFMSNVPSRVLVILDEAYFEYAESKSDYPNSMIYRYDNVITLRTFSKAHALAGLRVGYGFAHDSLISNLLKVKLPFEPSMVAQIAALSALSDTNYIKQSIKMNDDGMKQMESIFNKYEIDFIPSHANFITAKFKDKYSAKTFYQFLLQSGVITRYLSSFGLENCVRVTIGLESEIIKLEEKISKLCNEVNI